MSWKGCISWGVYARNVWLPSWTYVLCMYVYSEGVCIGGELFAGVYVERCMLWRKALFHSYCVYLSIHTIVCIFVYTHDGVYICLYTWQCVYLSIHMSVYLSIHTTVCIFSASVFSPGLLYFNQHNYHYEIN